MPMNKFFITTSIAYVNAPPHLGFALESIQADVIARYHREVGDSVFFQTGTDEHGIKILRAAQEAEDAPQLFVDKIAARFKDLKPALNLSWDVFVRTTDKDRHWPQVFKIWKALEANGDLYKKIYEGLYCVGCESFKTKKDLADGKCPIHKKEPEVVREENWFFKLSKYEDKLKNAIEDSAIKIVPEFRKNEVLAFLKEGLEDISLSRPRKDLPWGIPVPEDDNQTMYVWADALTNYIDYPEHWPADVHLIGKDILRFHAVIWPAMLLAAKLPLPKRIFAHGFITLDGHKISKSLGNTIDPFELIKKYGADPVRYYLLREIPSGEDGDFSVAKFEERYNGDLANGLGNFSARVLTLALKSGDILSGTLEGNVEEKIREAKETVRRKIDDFRLHEAIAAVWDLISFGDKYVNSHKIWEIKNEDERRSKIFNTIVLLDNVGALLAPFLPESAAKIKDSIVWDGGNMKVKKGENLFPRL